MDIIKGTIKQNEASLSGYKEEQENNENTYVYGKTNLVDVFNQEDLSLFGYKDEYDEDTSNYIYGKLNNECILKEYTALITETAETVINNTSNVISVNVLKVPYTLAITENEQKRYFDGSANVNINLDNYTLKSVYNNQIQEILNTKLDNNLGTENAGKHLIVASNGQIIPVSVDYENDVIEGYLYNNDFYEDQSYQHLIVGQRGKIYIDISDNIEYRYEGNTYIPLTVDLINDEQESSTQTYSSVKLNQTFMPKITSINKLSADLVEDGITNKVFTATEKAKLGNIEDNAQVNTLTGVKVNGTSLAIDSDKNVDVLIKKINTDNSQAQTTNSEEEIAGEGIINLHKIAKTGTASDLIGYNALAQASDLTALSSRVSTAEGDITTINSKFQSGVSANNPATSEDFVNSSINALAAFFITRTAAGDNFNTYAQLSSATTFYSGGQTRIPTQNDYTYVRYDETKGEIVTGYSSFTTTTDYIGHLVIYNNEGVEVTSSNKDSLGITPGTTIAYDNLPTTKYSYQGGTYPNGQWDFQLIVNNSALTAAQMAALNSGIDSAKVAQISTNQNNINSLSNTKVDKTTKINNKTLDSDISLTANDVGAEAAFSKNTAFNKNFETSTTNIKMNGSVSVGSSNNIARADHVHPSDSSKQDALSSTQLNTVNSGVTSADKTKLDTIQVGAQVNVQADWNQTNSSADDFIKNKPTFPDINTKVDISNEVTKNIAAYNFSGLFQGLTVPSINNANIENFIFNDDTNKLKIESKYLETGKSLQTYDPSDPETAIMSFTGDVSYINSLNIEENNYININESKVYADLTQAGSEFEQYDEASYTWDEQSEINSNSKELNIKSSTLERTRMGIDAAQVSMVGDMQAFSNINLTPTNGVVLQSTHLTNETTDQAGEVTSDEHRGESKLQLTFDQIKFTYKEYALNQNNDNINKELLFGNQNKIKNIESITTQFYDSQNDVLNSYNLTLPKKSGTILLDTDLPSGNNYVQKETVNTEEIGGTTVTYNKDILTDIETLPQALAIGATKDSRISDQNPKGALLILHADGYIEAQTTSDSYNNSISIHDQGVTIGASSNSNNEYHVTSLSITPTGASVGNLKVGYITPDLLSSDIGTQQEPFNAIYSKSFIKPNGTSSQFLKADGSVDNNTYATETYVQQNGGKIDTISVNGTQQTITNKNVDIAVPTQTSQLTNNSGFITNAVNDLTNYYLKTDTYTKTEVNTLFSSITTISLEIVSTLPTPGPTYYFNTSKTIYLVPKSTTQIQNTYDEYICTRAGTEGNYTYAWEKIGDTQIDLSNYVQKTFTIAGIDLQDNITTSELQTALTDSTHNFVTDTEKSTWNAKQNALSAAQLTAVNSGIDSTKVAQIATNTTDISNKMDKANPVGTGSLSLNRKANTTIGTNSISLGTDNEVTAQNALGVGLDNVVNAREAFASGRSNTASGYYSHAEGYGNSVLMQNGHVEGEYNTVSGRSAHAEGEYNIANHRDQHVFGSYNIADTSTQNASTKGNYIEIVGNGTADNARSNARTLDWSGNETLAGWLTMNNNVEAIGYDPNGTSTTEQTLLDNYYTKSQVDNLVHYIKNDVVGGLNWASFNTNSFNTTFGNNWASTLGIYGCRANTSNDTSGLTTSLGFSGTYYVEFKVWYVGTNNAGILITITDSVTNGYAHKAYANTIITIGTNTDVHTMFFDAYADSVKYNMCPSDNIVAFTDTPQTATVLFQAPCNGVAYLRYSVKAVNASNPHYMGFHLQSSSGSDKAYNTQYWTTSGDHMYNATFVMKAGQRIYCYEVVNLTINWGQTNFIKSEEQS